MQLESGRECSFFGEARRALSFRRPLNPIVLVATEPEDDELAGCTPTRCDLVGAHAFTSDMIVVWSRFMSLPIRG